VGDLVVDAHELVTTATAAPIQLDLERIGARLCCAWSGCGHGGDGGGGVSPPSIARNALTVLVLGAGWRRASPISTHKPARGVSSVRVDWDSGGAAKNWDSPPGPRSGDREGDPARVG
jgi:hypothetical protein